MRTGAPRSTKMGVAPEPKHRSAGDGAHGAEHPLHRREVPVGRETDRDSTRKSGGTSNILETRLSLKITWRRIYLATKACFAPQKFSHGLRWRPREYHRPAGQDGLRQSCLFA